MSILWWFTENWFMVVLAACAIAIAATYVKAFLSESREEQLEAVRNWLLIAVTEAEKKFGSGTGTLKLRAVYAEFCKVFPKLVNVIPFIVFSSMVDEVLKDMRNLLEKNDKIRAYVEGE